MCTLRLHVIPLIKSFYQKSLAYSNKGMFI